MTAQTSSARPLRHARDYAQAIVDAAGDVARQREIFQACPLELRGMARDMAKKALAKAEQVLEHCRLIRQAAERDPAPYTPTRSVLDFKKSSPEVCRERLAELRAAIGKKEPA
ncbi:hypothetical protein D9M70_574720 [compost metagenome]